MKKINILIWTTTLNIGGAEKHIYDLVLNINKNIYNIVVICLYDLGPIGEMLPGEKCVKVYHNLMRNKFDILGIWRLISIIRDENIDMIYIVHSPLTLFYGVLVAKLAGIRATLTRVTSTDPVHYVKRRIVNFLTLPFVDKVIAQAYSHKKYLVANENLDSRKIIVINNGIELSPFLKTFNKLSLRQSLNIPVSVPVIGIVANLRPEKGHIIFLKAARIILNIYPQTSFLIVGDGVEKNNLKKLSQKLDIQRNIFFLGLRKDIPQINSLFDVGVLASSPRVETFSNAVLEYMAASKPVVATNAGSIVEIIVDGKTGYIVPSDDDEAMASALMKILDNGDLARKMGEAGRKRVEEKFTLQRMIDKYESLFADLLN